MATPRKTAVSGELLPADQPTREEQAAFARMMLANPEPEQETDEPDPDDVALANVLAELGSSGADVKVNVYQIDEKRNRAFVGSFLPDNFSIELIQAQFGAGEYSVEVRKDKKWLKKTMIKVASPKNPAIIPGAAISPAQDTAKIIEAMQGGFAQMGQMFASALGQLAANQPKPKTSMEMLQEMALMRDIMGGNNPAPVGPDPMRLFEMATEIAEKITPRQGEPGAGEIILEAMKNFGPILNQAAQRPQQPAFPPPLMNNPALSNTTPTPPAAPITDKPAEQEPDQMNIARKMYLNLLIANAAADNDTMTYANLMLDVAGEDAALEFANRPDWFEALAGEEPRARQYPGWFARLRDDVMELTKPENESTDTGTPTP